MLIEEAQLGMTVETFCGQFGRIKQIIGKRAVIRCGPRHVENAISSLVWVPSPDEMRKHRREIKKSWGLDERERRCMRKMHYEIPQVSM